jgi:hypothetical protein
VSRSGEELAVIAPESGATDWGPDRRAAPKKKRVVPFKLKGRTNMKGWLWKVIFAPTIVLPTFGVGEHENGEDRRRLDPGKA